MGKDFHGCFVVYADVFLQRYAIFPEKRVGCQFIRYGSGDSWLVAATKPVYFDHFLLQLLIFRLYG
jgi:hypothetical protein